MVKSEKQLVTYSHSVAITSLGEDDHYAYLGANAGFKLDQNIDGTVVSITPWQKIDALNTSLLTNLSFALRTTAISSSALTDLD